LQIRKEWCALGLKTYGKGFSAGAGSGSMPTEFSKVESVAIGAATITRQPFTVLHVDLGMTQAPGGKRQRIAGILGLELFERFIVRIDYRDGTVILRPPGPLRYETASAIPLTFTSDMPLVQASRRQTEKAEKEKDETQKAAKLRKGKTVRKSKAARG
jgi:hypothetical protein